MVYVILAVVMGWAFERVHAIITAPNYDSLYNGFGVINLVNRGQARQPMAYRVLVPWLVMAIEKLPVKIERIAIYQAMKIVLNALVFLLIMQVFGVPAALLSAVLLLVTIKYDYWDWTVEIIGVCAALTGNLYLAVAGSVAHGLSKETAPLVPLAYFTATGDADGTYFLCVSTLAAMVLPRLIYRNKPMYCERFQWKYNLRLFRAFRDKGFWKWGQWFHTDIFIACSLTLGALVAVALRWQPDGIVPLAILGAGWLMAKADETRVFALVIPWIAWVMTRGL